MSVNLNFLLIFLVWLSAFAYAQPAITNLQLSKSSSEFTTLSGTGFGPFDGKVLSWDNFDDKPPASPLFQTAAIDGYGWSSGGNVQATVDKQFALSGSQSVKLDWQQGKNGFFGWKDKNSYPRLYMSYWRRMDGNLINGRYQQLQVFGKTKTPQLSLEIASGECWRIAGKLTSTQQATFNFSGDCWKQTIGKFQRWELWIDPQRSLINVWLDNLIAASIKPLSATTEGFSEVSLGYEAEGLEAGNTWFDDVYIASTQARVEACNAPEYNQCTHRYLQYVAAENWGATEIRFRLHNLRALRGEPIFLYVIDSRGQVSNGIAIARPVIKAN